ncbi:MAG: SurA N-terminal domain-containing protein [Muribaculaceae bacterium]|nr:SurA N-terminal domain-containing protein [Muribaculaceae bacterium]
MATLEKIRSKSVLLIVVIGLALLAFIIGDAITNSRNLFGEQTTVAKVGGTKIEYNDYVKKREELNAQLENARRQNPAQFANYDTQVLSQMALDQLMGEALLDQAADNAGIRTSSSQLSYYILQQPLNPRVNEIIQQLNVAGYGVSTPAQAYEIIFNPKRNGVTEAEMAPFQKYWVGMEAETAQMIRRNTYQRLLMGTVRANDLDKKALYNDYVGTKNVDIAYKPFGNVSDEKYAPTDKEIREEYENVKNNYKVDELTKEIAFIAVNIAPSDADRQAASQLAKQTASALRSNDATVNKDLRKEGVVVTHRQLREEDLPRGAVKDFLTSAPKDSVEIVQENIQGFTVVKMGNKKMEIDSLQLNIVQVIGQGLVAETLQGLNTGVSIDSIASVVSVDSVFVQKEQWIPLFNAQGATGALEASQVDSLLNAGNKYISLVSSPQGSVLAKVTSKSSPVLIYEYDEVNYDLKPSTATVSDARTKLEDFLVANETAKLFAENAPKEGYSIRNIDLTASTPAVPRMAGMQSFYPDSRQVVRWVMIDGKPGQVSHIYESKDAMSPALYAAAVLASYDDYTPLSNSDVRSAVSDRVRKSKAGEELMGEYNSQTSTIETAAQAMGVEPRNNATFRFSRTPQVRDAAVMGQIAGSKPGNVVLVKGDSGVYAYKIESENTENFPYTESQYEQQYFQMINPNMGEMLKGAKQYKNNIYKFEAGD